ncbi:MAG: FACT complex subunit [Chaenotheca gracillima]|nr:MAG: FACT complex subunit [Chaenotheca gracillima]
MSNAAADRDSVRAESPGPDVAMIEKAAGVITTSAARRDSASSHDSHGSSIGRRRRRVKSGIQEARHLPGGSGPSISGIVLDVIFSLFPIFFIYVACAAASLNGHDPYKNDRLWTESVVGVGQLLQTVYSEIFVFLGARSLAQIASWLLERGVKLGALEQIMGSMSLGSTLQSLKSFRKFRSGTFYLLGLSLVALWALSPLGSQSMGRLINIGQIDGKGPSELRYLNTDTRSALAAPLSDPDRDAIKKNYLSSVWAPGTVGYTSDLWYNIRIPLYESLNASANSSHGYIPVTLDEDFPGDADEYDFPHDPVYSSLLGIPFANVSRIENDYNLTMTMNSSYFLLDCPSTTTLSNEIVDLTNKTSTGWVSSEKNQGGQILRITTDALFGDDRTKNNPNPRHLIFLSQAEGDSSWSVANCTVTQTFVQSYVTCNQVEGPPATCQVVSQRKISTTTSTPLEDKATAMNFFSEFADTALEATADGAALFSVNETNNLATSSFEQASGPYLTTSGNLTMLLNSYWLASLAPRDFSGALPNTTTPQSVTRLADSVNWVIDTRDAYVVCIAWVIGLAVSASVLLILTTFGAAVKHLRAGPEILGYVSNYTRGQPYVRHPPGSNAMDGAERARFLYDVKIQLQDVDEADDDLGHLALASFEDDSERKKPLGRSKRLYV